MNYSLASTGRTGSLVELQSMESTENVSPYVAVKTSSENIQTVAEAEVMIENDAQQESQKASICQRLMNYVTKHPKIVIGVGLGLVFTGAAVFGGVMGAARMHNNNQDTSSCPGGQVFLVDYNEMGDDSPTCSVRIKENSDKSSSYSLFQSPLESKNESCHFVLENAYPSNGTKIFSFRASIRDTSSPELNFENSRGAIKADITSKAPSIKFENNCDIPDQYNKTCQGALDNQQIQTLISKGILKKIN